MKTFLQCLFILILLSLLSCHNDNKLTIDKEGELSFAIDSTILGTSIKDVNFSLIYSVPKLWLNSDYPVDLKTFDSTGYEKKNLNLSLHPLNVFMDSNSKSFLAVSELKSEFYNLNLKMIENEVTDLFKEKFDSLSFKKIIFVKDGIEFLQVLLMLKNAVNFKLIFPTKNNKFLQFDYFISRETYINEIKAVESSIGSIVYF